MNDISNDWNHVPDTPIVVSPLWQWPPDIRGTLKWYSDIWFIFTVNGGIVCLAFLAYFLTSPSFETATNPGFWMLGVYVRNLIIVTALAGTLHLYFHGYAKQGSALKYDKRPFPRKGRMFDFDDQLRDNMFWTLASGVTIWSGYEILFWWSMANGYVATITFTSNPIWFVAIFFLIPVWESFYFYWMHRVLHTRLFYRFHALHHRNTDIGPWSGLSMHPIEHLMYFGSVLVHFAIASHPVHIIFHLMFYGLYAITTHTGFEGLLSKGRKRLHLGNFHHQIHHRYFECNYGTLDVPWDKLFGSWHDGTNKGKEKMKQRLKDRASLRH